MLLLGSTSVLFFVCVTPMVLLSILITPQLLKSLPFQVKKKKYGKLVLLKNL